MDGICSFWEAAQALVASLAERQGLLAHPPAAVENAREKQVNVLSFSDNTNKLKIDSCMMGKPQANLIIALCNIVMQQYCLLHGIVQVSSP